MQKNAVDGRTRLLDAAARAFNVGGYDQVGVAQILQGAGVQAPTLYHHFGDKEGLYLEWACAGLAQIEDKLAPLAAGVTATAEALRAFAVTLTTDLPFDLRQLLRDAERLQKPESRERVTAAYLQAIYNPLYTILVRAIGKRDVRNEPVGLLAEAFIAGSLALGRHGWRSGTGGEEGATWWTEQFLYGCAPRS